jgi:phosphoglucosamine mutase
MKRRFFGTDGIRGKTGQHPITPDFFVKLGFAAGKVLTEHHKSKVNPSVVIGKDTRISGYMFESALEAGFSAAGVDTYLTGPLPTPGIAYLTQELESEIGVSITASHNPFDDNGVKFFTKNGEKISEAMEEKIEALMDEGIQSVNPDQLGKARRLDEAQERYIRFCLNTVPKTYNFRKFKIVLDCAHGATYQVAPKVFKALGIQTVVINNQPDGLNINLNAGSTHPELLEKAVVEQKADLGLAFDGDGDRLIAVDSTGRIIDGDEILYLILNYFQKQKMLSGGLVGTLMTNLALEEKCKSWDIPFERANVGDRYVSEVLRQKKWQLGGENSGHIVMLNFHSTGDGIVSALQLLCALVAENQSLQESLEGFRLYPQKLINVPIKENMDLNSSHNQNLIKQANEIMRGEGRVLIRPSGTQPLLRIMTEGPDASLVEQSVQFLKENLK